jgi:hypothetical protein
MVVPVVVMKPTNGGKLMRDIQNCGNSRHSVPDSMSERGACLPAKGGRSANFGEKTGNWIAAEQ